MHVLVTGGAGFIGSHSTDRLLADGARVRVLDNFSSGKRENLARHQRLEVVSGDIRDETAVASAMAGVSHVLHLAAQVSVAVSVQAPLESTAINVGGFLNVLDAARRAGVQRFVYASSAAVYGVPETLPLTEAAATAPISPYGLDKLVNDQYAALYHQLYGSSTLGLRYFNVFGPRQDPSSPYSGVISVFSDRLRRGDTLTVNGDGLHTRDFIYVGDVARANAAALGGKALGVCNVATGTTSTLLELIAALAEASGSTPNLRHGPPREGDIVHSSANNRRLVEELGVAGFTDLADGLRELLAAS